ncbi:MAG: hypothetical protein ACLPID_04195, partial [Beijerinckiaceae bacterium]
LSEEADQVASLISRFDVGANVVELPREDAAGKARKKPVFAGPPPHVQHSPSLSVVKQGGALRKAAAEPQEKDWEEF